MTDCAGACVNTSTDPKNCGSCGIDCGGNICKAGVCDPCNCPDALICCGGSCVDPQSDNNNCGACGNVCDTKSGLTCENGLCCIGGWANCSGACVDLESDNNNCGSCGNVCSPAGSLACHGGLCVSKTCEDLGLTTCSGTTTCVVISNDPNNCGACGVVCPTGQACVNGQCT